jgi:hypothetical protein
MRSLFRSYAPRDQLRGHRIGQPDLGKEVVFCRPSAVPIAERPADTVWDLSTGAADRREGPRLLTVTGHWATDELRHNHWGVEARGRIPRRNDDDGHGASLIRVQLRLGCPGVAKPASPRVTAALRSTVLGPAIEFAFSAGDVVAARCASVPGAVGLVFLAVRGALVVDGPRGLVERTASLRPRPTNCDSRGDDDGPGGRQERPEDRRGHEGQPVTQTTKQFMRQLMYSSPWAGHHVGPDAKIIGAHRGMTDHKANVMRVNMTSCSSLLTICVWGSLGCGEALLVGEGGASLLTRRR